MSLCKVCYKPLSDEEVKFYESECEECVQDNHHRLQCWKSGLEDSELDDIYSDVHVGLFINANKRYRQIRFAV